jgi:hypothetical protein
MEKLLALALCFACTLAFGLFAFVFNIHRVKSGIGKAVSYGYIWVSFFAMLFLVVGMFFQLDEVMK